MRLLSLLPPVLLFLLACSGATTPSAPPAPPAAPVAKTWNPSFNCDKASTPTEHRICNSETLSDLDRQLADGWKAATAAHPDMKDSLKSQQRNWLKGNSSCTDDPCLEARYRDRIGFLKGVASIPGKGSGYSGTWQDGMNDIAILQNGQNIEYNLEAFRVVSDEDVYMGFAHGNAALTGTSAVAHPDDTTGCTLRFEFQGESLKLEQEGGDSDCGFGMGVYAGGTYTRVNRTPDMNAPE
jgi:uncharacterized protein